MRTRAWSCPLIRSYLSHPAVQNWWAEGRNFFHPDFVDHVEGNLMRGLEATPGHREAGKESLGGGTANAIDLPKS